MSGLQDRLNKALDQARAGVSQAEVEAGKVLGRLADAAGVTPDEVKRRARALADGVRTRRRGLEKAVDEAVKTVSDRVLLPSRGEVETLRARVDELTARIEALEGRKEKPSA